MAVKHRLKPTIAAEGLEIQKTGRKRGGVTLPNKNTTRSLLVNAVDTSDPGYEIVEHTRDSTLRGFDYLLTSDVNFPREKDSTAFKTDRERGGRKKNSFFFGESRCVT